MTEGPYRATHLQITQRDDIVRLAFGRSFETGPVYAVTVDIPIVLAAQMGLSVGQDPPLTLV